MKLTCQKSREIEMKWLILTRSYGPSFTRTSKIIIIGNAIDLHLSPRNEKWADGSTLLLPIPILQPGLKEYKRVKGMRVRGVCCQLVSCGGEGRDCWWGVRLGWLQFKRNVELFLPSLFR